MKPYCPQHGGQRIRSAREQSAGDPRERVAASGDTKARSAAPVCPHRLVGRDDVADDAFDEYDRLVELRRFYAADDRLALDFLRLAIKQRGELARMGQEQWQR